MPLFMGGTILFLKVSFIMLHSYKWLQSELLRNIRNLLRNLNIFIITNYHHLISMWFFYVQIEKEKTISYDWTKNSVAYILRSSDVVVTSFHIQGGVLPLYSPSGIPPPPLEYPYFSPSLSLPFIRTPGLL
jgi:hypothetical protein